MKKRVTAMVLVPLFALSMTAYAAESRANKVIPSLTFDGTTANCEVLISDPGAEIEVTLTLYRTLSRIGSWSASGTSYVVINEECEVKNGLEYRLVATGTIDGVDFSEEVTGTCGE